MNNNFAHISIVLDRSGSMASVKTATILGFNTFLAGQKAVPGKCTLTLTQFDSEGIYSRIETLYNGIEIASVPPLTESSFVPRGGTPLYDAVAQGIRDTGNWLQRMPEMQRPAKVVFVIITDGEENSSRQTTVQNILDTIKHQTDVYKWEFVFIGANINAEKVGQSLGLSVSNCMTSAHNDTGVSAMYASTGANLRRYRSGEVGTMSFSSQQKKEQAEAASQP